MWFVDGIAAVAISIDAIISHQVFQVMNKTNAATINLKKSLMDWHVFAVAHSTILSLHCVRKGVHIHIYTMFMAALKTNSVCLRRVFMCGMVGHVEAVIT